jgi:hypothetical protein
MSFKCMTLLQALPSITTHTHGHSVQRQVRSHQHLVHALASSAMVNMGLCKGVTHTHKHTHTYLEKRQQRHVQCVVCHRRVGLEEAQHEALCCD